MDINITNYETFFLLYADNELDAVGRLSVEKFIGQHPAYRAELDLLLSAGFQADERIVFPDHALLLHPEKERRMIPVFWLRAAAVVLLLVSGILYMLFNRTAARQKEHDVVIAATQVPIKPAVIPVTPHAPAPKAIPSVLLVHASSASQPKHAAIIPQYPSTVLPQDIKPAEREPVVEPALAVARQLPSLDRRTSSAPMTENVLEADDEAPAISSEKNSAQTATIQTAVDLHPDTDETANAVNVFAVNKKNKALSALFNRASRTTRATENNALASAGVRVSLFQINLK